MKKSYKIYVDSANWLCEINLLGYSMINRYIIENDHKIIDDSSDADFIIINSCGFTKDHEDTSISLFKQHYLKKEKKSTIIIFGCLVKINKKLIDSLDTYPIDFDEGEKLDKIFYKKIKFKDIRPSCDTKKLENLFFNKIIVYPSKILPVFVTKLMSPFSKKLKMNYQKIIDNLISKNKILIEIGKGCASNCKYCAIKKTRGNIRSRQINDILIDIEKFYDPTKELFLVADDCSCYGLDIQTSLIDLLYEIKKKFPDLLIDLDNINPCWLEKYPDEYIKLFSEFNISYATVPVQSGSNRIIKDMNRNYDIKKILNIIKKIKKVSPKTAIYTHFIICYPEETLIDYLKTIRCAMFFDLPIAFEYSEPKDSARSSVLDFKSRFVRTYRLTFFMVFLNFFVFYRLLTIPNQNKKSVKEIS
jgi:tRNA A37 methylthiotransferase MiaB